MNKLGKLEVVLQFLALSRDQKKSVIPANKERRSWEIFETHIQTSQPSLCVTYECWNCLDRPFCDLESEDQKLINEIKTLLNLMIEIRDEYKPIWTICDEKRFVESDAEHIWAVVERLAKLLLQRLGWPQSVPELSFRQFITIGREVSGS